MLLCQGTTHPSKDSGRLVAVAILGGLGQSLQMIGQLVLALKQVRAEEVCITIQSASAQTWSTGLTGNALTGETTFGTQLPAFSSENAAFPVQGVEVDVIKKILACFEISKCVQSSPTKTKTKINKKHLCGCC